MLFFYLVIAGSRTEQIRYVWLRYFLSCLWGASSSPGSFEECFVSITGAGKSPPLPLSSNGPELRLTTLQRCFCSRTTIQSMATQTKHKKSPLVISFLAKRKILLQNCTNFFLLFKDLGFVYEILLEMKVIFLIWFPI